MKISTLFMLTGHYRLLTALFLALFSISGISEETNFLADGQLVLHPRFYSLERNYDNQVGLSGFDNNQPIYTFESRGDRQAATLGGWLAYETAFSHHIRLGLSFYNATKLYGPSDKPGSGLLDNQQDNLNSLGQSYFDIGFDKDNYLRTGRQEISTPFIGKQDNRAIPKTYMGSTARFKTKHLKGYAGYVNKIKSQNTEEFINIAEFMGINNQNEAIYYLGSQFNPQNNINSQLWFYHVDNAYRLFYIDSMFKLANSSHHLNAGLQYTRQQTDGQGLLGDDIDSYQYGALLQYQYQPFKLELAYTRIGDNAGMNTFFSTPPFYTAAIIGFFERADEKATMLRGIYNFKNWGIPELSLDIRLVDSSVPNTDTGGDLFEKNYTLKYKITEGPMDSLTIQFRRADLSFSENPDFIEDRIMLDYNYRIW